MPSLQASTSKPLLVFRRTPTDLALGGLTGGPILHPTYGVTSKLPHPTQALGWTGHHALLCSRAQMSWRHDVIAETWQAICRDAGLSVEQKPAEFSPGEHRRISDACCRGVAGDLPVHLDVVVTSSIHNHANEWQFASEGVAVAREERRKFANGETTKSWDARRDSSPLAFESQGRWGRSAIAELERLARLKAGLMAGSPMEAANVATGSLARWRRWLSVVLQRLTAAMVLAPLGQPKPVPIDADLLKGESDIRVVGVFAHEPLTFPLLIESE